MSYLVLARKYRPRDFESVIGQKDLTEVLRGAIKDDRVGHAYLFCGPRGTGKTTTARIFAKALNCVEGPTPTPCGVCERCVAADAGRELDIIEIDAASHTGVDYVRALRDEAAYAPMAARYKIYLIDEVHMLSKAAFNALLKTLEEPPPHVKFLFATTEPQKLLDTVLSRCQILRLAPITEVEIAGRLDFVLDAEGFTPEDGVTREVARLARGGMRDALSMADQLIALAGTSPTVADVARLGGEGGLAELDALLRFVEDKEAGKVLEALPAREGGEREFTGRILSHLRQALVVSLCGANSPLVEASKEERAVLDERAKRMGGERLQVWLEQLLAARERMRLLPEQARMVLEVALLDLARPGGDMPLSELVARLAKLEARLASGAPAPPPHASEAPPPRPRDAARSAAEPPQKPTMLRRDTSPNADAAAPASAAPKSAAAHAATDNAALWKASLDQLKKRHGEAARLFGRAARLGGIEGSVARVTTRAMPDADRKVLEDRRVLGALGRALGEAIGREVQVTLEVGEVKKEAPGPGPDEFADRVAEMFGGIVEQE